MIGFTPAEVNDMSFWEFGCAVAGYAEAHGAEPQITYPSDEEFAQALLRVN